MSRASLSSPAHKASTTRSAKRPSRQQPSLASLSGSNAAPAKQVLAHAATDTYSQYETLETATLPRGEYRVVLALEKGCEADAAMRAAALVKGQEVLHDAQRRGGEQEGVIDHAQGEGQWGSKRRRVDKHDAKAGGVGVDEPLWSTAPLRYPCICEWMLMSYLLWI